VSPTDEPAASARRRSSAPRPPTAHPIRVLLVDDHRLVLDALTRVIGLEPDMRIVGAAVSVAEVREAAGVPVDVTLMDYHLQDGTGVEATRLIKARWPSCRVLMLTGIDDDETILESIQAGADGYLTKDRVVAEVVAAVRAAHEGAILLPPSTVVTIARRVAEARDRRAAQAPVVPLTPRELEILRALTEGLATREICERLAIAPNTLRTHVQNIMGKLHVHSKLEAVAFALRHKLVEPPRAK
jgi:two-component system NarL family response regulator